MEAASECMYHHGGGSAHHEFLVPVLTQWLQGEAGPLLDIGCGNGALTARIREAVGIACTGIDSSASGIRHAQATYPTVTFLRHSVSDPVPEELRGAFRLVTAMEVIEHLFMPAQLFARAEEALAPDGKLILSTPYHGYLKNVLIAASGKFDSHVNPLLDYGHIKFFSPNTLTRLAEQCGWRLRKLDRVGRIKPLAKSMVAMFQRREAE